MSVFSIFKSFCHISAIFKDTTKVLKKKTFRTTRATRMIRPIVHRVSVRATVYELYAKNVFLDFLGPATKLKIDFSPIVVLDES